MRTSGIAVQGSTGFAFRGDLYKGDPCPKMRRAVGVVEELRVAVAVHLVRDRHPFEFLEAAGAVILVNIIPVLYPPTHLGSSESPNGNRAGASSTSPNLKAARTSAARRSSNTILLVEREMFSMRLPRPDRSCYLPGPRRNYRNL